MTGQRKSSSRWTTDDLSDVTVFRELEKMKKFIIDHVDRCEIKSIKFSYGTGAEINKVTLTITFMDDTTVSDSFDVNTIEEITTEVEGEILYLVVTMTNGVFYRAPIDISGFVTVETNQTITGDKLFVGDVQVPDIEHGEGEEQIQETNKAVNERFLKIHATERIDSIEDELGDVGQEGTVRGDIAVLKDDMSGAKQDILDAFDDIRYLDDNKQVKLLSGTNIKTVNGESILGPGNIPISLVGTWGDIGGNIQEQTDLQEEFGTKVDKSNGYWKVPTNWNELISSQFILLATYFKSTCDSTGWNEIPSNPSFTTTIVPRTILSLSRHDGYNDYNVSRVIADVNSHYVELIEGLKLQNVIQLRGILFNGAGSVIGSMPILQINESNYSTYIDLKLCRIWVTE